MCVAVECPEPVAFGQRVPDRSRVAWRTGGRIGVVGGITDRGVRQRGGRDNTVIVFDFRCEQMEAGAHGVKPGQMSAGQADIKIVPIPYLRSAPSHLGQCTQARIGLVFGNTVRMVEQLRPQCALYSPDEFAFFGGSGDGCRIQCIDPPRVDKPCPCVSAVDAFCFMSM